MSLRQLLIGVGVVCVWGGFTAWLYSLTPTGQNASDEAAKAIVLLVAPMGIVAILVAIVLTFVMLVHGIDQLIDWVTKPK